MNTINLNDFKISLTSLDESYGHIGFLTVSLNENGNQNKAPQINCALCQKSIKRGNAAALVDKEQETILCTQEADGEGHKMELRSHLLHTWCAQSLVAENASKCPVCKVESDRLPVDKRGREELARIGFDVGGVVIRRIETANWNDTTEDEPSLFGKDFLDTKPADGAVEALRQFCDSRGGENIYIISKCRSNMQSRIAQWMKHTEFHESAGVAFERVRFCLEKKDKAPIVKSLGLHAFVDDRTDVLQHMLSLSTSLFLFMPSESRKSTALYWHPRMRKISGWQELVDLLI